MMRWIARPTAAVALLTALTTLATTATIVLIAPTPAEARGRWKTINYTIQKGDNLGKIAQKYKKYDVTVKKLKQWNRRLDPRRMRPGQKVRILVPIKTYRKSKQRQAIEVQRRIARQDGPLSKIEVKEADPTALPQDPTHPKQAAFDAEDARVRAALASGNPEDTVTYTSRNGENLGTIALKFVLDVDDIKGWNKLDDVRIAPNTKLVFHPDKKVPPPTGPVAISYKVQKGDNLGKIAKKYEKSGVTVDKIKRWNKKLNPRRMRVGQSIRLYVPPKSNGGRSASYGRPQRGRLIGGVSMDTSTGIRVRRTELAYGTRRVVRLLKAAAADVQARWPETPNLVLGDISKRHGGRLKRHNSHQSGRDADVSFYHRGNIQTPDFLSMDAETFDAARNWHIFKTLIDGRHVSYIFIDYPLQKLLYNYALSIGYTPDQLKHVIQYPSPVTANVGIIRHVPGHADHWHIRFSCGPKDGSCQD